jgi:hypothetical protein
MRVLTTIAKKKHAVIALIFLDKVRSKKQKFRSRFIHQGSAEGRYGTRNEGALTEILSIGAVPPIFLRVALVAAEPSAADRTKSELLLDRLRR